MPVNGLHLLLTYECPFECDHCFVWSGPNARRGTMSVADLRKIVREGKKLRSVTNVYFEGGESFLYYPLVLAGLRIVRDAGLDAGIVTNGYWATSHEDALEWLRPIRKIGVKDFSVSHDALHYGEDDEDRAATAVRAAKALGLPVTEISLRDPRPGTHARHGKVVTGGDIMFRGRAAKKLVRGMPRRPWSSFDRCFDEDLRDPKRVHIDPFGHVHMCNGISIGNFRERPLSRILRDYDPEADPICGPLLRGGPAELVRTYRVPHGPAYVDECHLCDDARRKLRERFPEILAPDQVYGTHG
jgi:MoaA/NifB/PqqE/SkfB family radical SAM enzyme